MSVGRAFVSTEVGVVTIKTLIVPFRERTVEMAQCEICGNEYDKAFEVTMSGGDSHTFDSFECAIHALAPSCEYCGVKVIGHGVEADGHFYCCAHCASMAGAEGVADRA
jgi:hypothetical protein